MKAKVKTTQQIVNVTCYDATTDPYHASWEDEYGGKHLGTELIFDDLTDYKTFTENLVHDLAVAAYHCHNGEVPSQKRKAVADDIVLLAFAITDKLMQENKTWR